MVSKKQTELEKVFEAFPILVAIRDGNEGERIREYIEVAVAPTFGIARTTAYQIAMQGTPTKWPKRENKQNAANGWFTSSVNKARNLLPATVTSITEESAFDRAILAGQEMRSRARLGNVLGDIQGVSTSTRHPLVVTAVRQASMALASALLVPIVPGDVQDYGVDWAPDAQETMDRAAASWGVEPFFHAVCTGCGVRHQRQVDAHDIVNVEELLATLEQQFALATAPVEPSA